MAQRPTHFLIRWAKWYGPLALILLALWFGFQPDIHGQRDWKGPAMIVVAILAISWFFLWRPKKPKGAP